MNVFNPMEGLNAFSAGARIGSGIRQAQTNKTLAPMVAAGDYKGAADYAGQRGDVAGADAFRAQYEQQLAQMDEAQKAQVAQNTETLARVAYGARQKTYPERKAYLAQRANELASIGYSVEQLDQFDPTDQAIDDIIAQVTPLADLLKKPEYTNVQNADGTHSAFNKSTGEYGAPNGPTTPEAPTKYSFEQIGEDIFAIDPTNPENKMRVGPAPAKAPLVQNTINSGDKAREDAFGKGLGQNAANEWQTIKTKGMEAATAIGKADMLDFLLGEIDYTGFGGRTFFAAQKALQSLGFNVGDDVGAKEAAEALTKEMGLALKKDLPGPMSNADREFLMSIPASITTTEAGNDALLYMYRQRNRYEYELMNYMYEANPRTEEQYNAAIRDFNLNYGPIFNEEDKRGLMSALTGAAP